MRLLISAVLAVGVGCSLKPTSLDESAGRLPAGQVLDAGGYAYTPGDRSCDGYPRLNVRTAPGTCLGLVVPRSGNKLIMPRTIVQIKDSPDFFLIDMGGWKENNGTLYLMKPGGSSGYELVKIKDGLNMPHGLGYGRNGWIYVGESHRISRFQWLQGELKNWELVYDKLVRGKGYMHPLTQFAFNAANGDMFINYGSPTDHCFKDGKGVYQNCDEEYVQGAAAILRIPGSLLVKKMPPGGVTATEQIAGGLRNSMAMVVHPSGTLIQGENSRDFPELEEPYEEVNVLHTSKQNPHFGWPYCYNFHAVSPEWMYPENKKSPMVQKFQSKVDCSQVYAKDKIRGYQAPWILLPPHSAPLHAAYYHGSMFKELNGKLLFSLHGYQPPGHRLIAFATNGKGMPEVLPEGQKSHFFFDQKGGCPVKKEYTPRGGVDNYAQHEELISGWDQVKGVRPKGAPVGFTVADDGSIYIVEDRDNRTVVRLARSHDPAPRPGQSNCTQPDSNINIVDPRIELLAWRHAANRNAFVRDGLATVKSQIIDKYCASCHAGFIEKDIAEDHYMLMDMLVKNEWFTPGMSAKSKIVQAIEQTGEFPPMPPADKPQLLGHAEGEAALATLKKWIDGLPKDVDKTFAKIELGSTRRIRNMAGTAGKACGAFEAGDSLYVNPQDRVTKDGWVWSEVYILPKDGRLFFEACPYPSDGVYWVALTKAR